MIAERTQEVARRAECLDLEIRDIEKSRQRLAYRWVVIDHGNPLAGSEHGRHLPQGA
jgi:hypothetical protein